MPSCNYCGTYLLFGGSRSQKGDAYCSDDCLSRGVLLDFAERISPEVLESKIQEVAAGRCPQCHGPGPVDVYVSYRIWSALVLTSWSSVPRICCRSCAVKNGLSGMLYSTVLGWWGFPWGLLGTPIQLLRNLGAIAGGPKSRPSPELRKMLKVALAADLIEQMQSQESE